MHYNEFQAVKLARQLIEDDDDDDDDEADEHSATACGDPPMPSDTAPCDSVNRTGDTDVLMEDV